MGNERPSLRKSWKFPGSAWVQQARAAFRPTCCWLMQVLPMSGLHPRDPLQGRKTDIAREVRCSRQCRRRIESRYPLTFPRKDLCETLALGKGGVWESAPLEMDKASSSHLLSKVHKKEPSSKVDEVLSDSRILASVTLARLDAPSCSPMDRRILQTAIPVYGDSY